MDHLSADAAHAWQREVWRPVGLGNVLVELVQVVAQQLGHNKQVLTMVEEVEHAEGVVLVVRVMLIDMAQQLDLAERQIDKILVISDDLDAHLPPCCQLDALHCAREDAGAQVVTDLVPTSNDRVDCDGKVDGLLESGAQRVVHHLEVKRTHTGGLLLLVLLTLLSPTVTWKEDYLRWVCFHREVRKVVGGRSLDRPLA